MRIFALSNCAFTLFERNNNMSEEKKNGVDGQNLDNASAKGSNEGKSTNANPPRKKAILIGGICAAVLAIVAVVLIIVLGGKNNTPPDQNDDSGGIINQDPGNTTDPTPGVTRYIVTVKSFGGMPLSGVMVYVHSGDGWMPVVKPVETDENGQAFFDLPTSTDYSVELTDVPDGYIVLDGETRDTRYPMSTTGALITLASAPAKGDIAKSYNTGDVMHDFTLTDFDGNDYTLSEILKDKDMVMLNFWYRNCSSCLGEFPTLNSVYQQYSDKIEMLAINDYEPDSLSTAQSLLNYYDFDIEFPLFKIKYGADVPTYDKFEDSKGYPTTVIIDRYGVICLVIVGGMSSESKWQKIFDHFTADDYEQKLIYNIDDLVPRVEATEKWVSSDNIASSLNGGDYDITYRPEENDVYSWPFVPTTYDGRNCVKPSNALIDNSYSILYADVVLEKDQAITFEYFCSTESESDIVYVLVNGNIIFTLWGVEDESWREACAYVALEAGTYELALVYKKDDDGHDGDDTIYLTNLQVVPLSELPMNTHIFRYAATDPIDGGSAFGSYASVFLNPNDGYYHVGSVDGPLLLVDHLGYTQFDDNFSISYRVHLNYELMVNDENKFKNWLIYGNCASNSDMEGYTPVTEELKEYLVAYCDKYRLEVGKNADENLWLSLCIYYDAYGPTVEHIEDPTKGLCDFSAFDTVLDNPATPEIETNKVVYNKLVMPRGLLYKFTPDVSGVYRITSISDAETIGYIFTGNHYEWADLIDMESLSINRPELTNSAVGERFNPDLIIDNGDGTFTLDNTNISMAAYLKAGVTYYINLAFDDPYRTGNFEFKVQYVADSFDYFIQPSPGPVTFIQNANGGIGNYIAAGIDYIFVDDGTGTKYAHELKGYDNNGDPIIGKKIYADFYYPTIHFPTQSIQALIKANAFNFNITELDREAIVELEQMKLRGIEKYGENHGSDALEALGLSAIPNPVLYEAIEAIVKGETYTNMEYTPEQTAAIVEVVTEGITEIKKTWALANVESLSSYIWTTFDMDNVIRGKFSDDPDTRAAQEGYLADVNTEFTSKWAYYRMDDVLDGTFHTTDEDRMSNKDIRAKEYLEYLNQYGSAALMEYWDIEYDFIKPGADDNVPANEVSAWRFNYMWEYFEMDDVNNGIYHGNIHDYTERIKYYESLMDNDPNHPERQGCVAVTEELAQILDALFSKYVFEDTINSWLKFCYYYQELGA